MNVRTYSNATSPKLRAGEAAHDPRRSRRSVSIDIGNDRDGEFFDIAASQPAAVDLSVVDAQPRLRHLVLMSRDDDGKHKFLCGHDERHWFVAAVPETAAVSTVATAMEALKPVGCSSAAATSLP